MANLQSLTQIASSQGDGSGTIDANVAGVTITGATTASPVVCTAASHGFSDGDWVWIDGATGTTEINGLRQITNKDTNTFELLDEGGSAVNSAGTFGGTVDAQLAFVVKPAANVVYSLHRINGMAADASAPVVDGLLGVARLTNGIIVDIYDENGLVMTLTPTPVKGWRDWVLYTGGGDAPLSDITNNKLESGFRWTPEKYGPRISLNGNNGEMLVIHSVDDLDGLSALRFSVQGTDNTF